VNTVFVLFHTRIFSAGISCGFFCERRTILVIRIKNLNFSYTDGLRPLFSGLSLIIDTDWKLALVGKNGAGKSTLLKLLCGELKGSGNITANVPFRRFPCDITDGGLSAYEIYCRSAVDSDIWRLKKELKLLGLDEEILYRPYETLSGGERTKFQLAMTFAQEGYALIDEPTDHLDARGRERLAKYLSDKNGFIVVSHDRAFLDGCCDHVLALESTGQVITRGNYTVYAEEREKRKTADAAKKIKLEGERTRLSRAAARISGWGEAAERNISNRNGRLNGKYAAIDKGFLSGRAAKAQKRANAAADRSARAESEIKELLKGYEEEEELFMQPEKFFRDEYLKLSDISVSAANKRLIDGLNFGLHEGERIAVTGSNGAGKSTLLKLICGICGGQTEYSGEIRISPRLKISYVPQICENEGYLGGYARSYGIDEGYFKAILTKLGFDGKDLARDMRYFSQGQKKKTALARSLCEKANLYIWDEPLNYLDIPSRERLERAILSSGATLLFVEHDRKFIENVATGTLEI